MNRSSVAVQENTNKSHVTRSNIPGSREGSQFATDRQSLVATQPVLKTIKPLVQPKLKIGSPNDKYEQEADRVADQVMRMPDSLVSSTSNGQGSVNHNDSGNGVIRRACASCSSEYKTAEKEERPVISSNLCPKCRVQTKPISESITPLLQRQEMGEEEEETIQAKSAGQMPAMTSNVENGIQSLKGGGQSLSRESRNYFEPRFGHDFSKVRIHSGGQAANLAGSINAKAFTLGQNVVFGAGQYQPYSNSGQLLLAHELAHVVQQNGRGGKHQVSRQPANGAPPVYRDCTPAITGIADSNLRLENGRQRARGFVGAASRALASAPVAGSVYATALARHFIAPTAAQRAQIQANFNQIMRTLVVPNFICNSNNICNGEQAFWIPQDDLIHVCRPFWGTSITCRGIILVHEGAHDIGVDGGVGGHPPNRGSAQYPAGNNPPPAGQTTALRMTNPDAYAFFAAHIFRNSDTGRTCF